MIIAVVCLFGLMMRIKRVCVTATTTTSTNKTHAHELSVSIVVIVGGADDDDEICGLCRGCKDVSKEKKNYFARKQYAQAIV